MASLTERVCAAYRLPIAPELVLSSSGLETSGYLKLKLAFQLLFQHIGDVVPQPAISNQTGSRSVERALGASYGATGWACKAEDHEADLQALSSARRSRRRSLSGSGGCHVFPYVKKS